MLLPDRGQSTGAAVELNGIRKSYDRTLVLREFSLSVAAGEFISLLGPSGCGKTTTLNLIAGFLDPDRGEILIDGRSMAGVPPHRRGLAMVFQNYALFPHMTVEQNVGFGPRMRGIPENEIRDRTAQALALVRLEEMADRYPAMLSGGQQQRAALARALAVRPRVMLLDEPLSNLDARLRTDMQVELRSIHQAVKTTMIYVTHDQGEALSLSDRVVVLNSGIVEQVGRPEELYTAPASEFVAQFIGDANLLDGSVLESTPEGTLVRIASGGSIRAGSHRNRAVGRSVRLAIRPDRLHLERVVTRPESRGDGLEGVVVGRSFRGAMIRYHIALGDGQPIVAADVLHNDAEVGGGERVRVHARPEDWIVFDQAS